MADLSEARQKFRRAKNHYETLRPEIEAFRDRDDHRITVDIDVDAGEYVFRVFDLLTPNAEWGLQIGDCLHNARSALDYLTVRLYAVGTGEDPRDIETIQFPVCDSKDKFTDTRTVKEFRKCPALSCYLTRIEELQPFNEHNPAIWGKSDPLTPSGRHAPLPLALSKLSRWDNIDKHRVIHATLLSGAVKFIDVVRAPPEFKLIHQWTAHEPLKDGAKIGRWRFETPFPSTWEPSEVDMKRYFPLEISLDQPFPPKAVLQVLPICLWGVNTVLEVFEPVFAEGKPPLPVTAIL